MEDQNLKFVVRQSRIRKMIRKEIRIVDTISNSKILFYALIL